MTKEIHSSGLPTPGLHPEMGDSYTEEAPYSEIVAAGPYLFNTVWASDYETGILSRREGGAMGLVGQCGA